MRQPVEKPSNVLCAIFHCLFDCHHSELSRVFTIKHRTYQVCLACGQELDYSLSRMHSLPPRRPHNAPASGRAAWSVQGIPLQDSGVR